SYDPDPTLRARSYKDKNDPSDRWHLEGDSWVGNWSWCRPLRGRVADDMASLISCIGLLQLNKDVDDRWTWNMDASGYFKVSTLSKRIQNTNLAEFIMDMHHHWNLLVSRKVNICVWRAVKDIDHAFIKCSHPLAIWRKIWRWRNFPTLVTFPSFSIKDIAQGNVGGNGCSRISKVVHGVFLTTIWFIWNWRNRLVNAHLDEVLKIKDERHFSGYSKALEDSDLSSFGVYVSKLEELGRKAF
nr:hypothetical protein [Tanacetum cinerariifolium]